LFLVFLGKRKEKDDIHRPAVDCCPSKKRREGDGFTHSQRKKKGKMKEIGNIYFFYNIIYMDNSGN